MKLSFINYNKSKYNGDTKIIRLIRIGNYAINLISKKP